MLRICVLAQWAPVGFAIRPGDTAAPAAEAKKVWRCIDGARWIRLKCEDGNAAISQIVRPAPVSTASMLRNQASTMLQPVCSRFAPEDKKPIGLTLRR